ncbi:MAG: ATP phosphoribosyltransferase regulatory subunit [Rhodobacter sp.]|nr:ATP phosphoribosyltransferase regulatory subunit [Rhodobacter sp.]
MSTPAGRARDAEQARLVVRFMAEGAALVDPPVLQPAETLLDLYGEDIRARAYVTRDPLAGELMLRPDFTVPVVQLHIAGGAAAARYVYAGKVFRVQEQGVERPSEYDQVGFEIFDAADPAASDAAVFALFAEVLAPLGLRAATGDIGVLMAAVQGLSTTDRRKAALSRHIWRPRRFRALLDRFGGRSPVPPTRAALLARVAAGEDVAAAAGPMIGRRSRDEIAARVDALVADAAEPPVSAGEVELLDEILGLRDKAPAALARLRDVAVDLPSVSDAVDRLAARLEALAARGVDVAALDFEGSYGRTQMEYYDGFVFGFYAETRPDLPPVATGGRYDALTRALGGPAAVPAVGGVIRPALTLELAA